MLCSVSVYSRSTHSSSHDTTVQLIGIVYDGVSIDSRGTSKLDCN